MSNKLTNKQLESFRTAFDIAKAKSKPRIKSDAEFARLYLQIDSSVLSKFFSGHYYSYRIHDRIQSFIVDIDSSLEEMIPTVNSAHQQNPEGETS